MNPDRIRNNDEMMINIDGIFENNTFDTKIEKAACPGRRVSWVDVDNDDLLDIYVDCGRGIEPRALYPNQLHNQKEAGLFENSSEALGLDIPEAGSSVWRKLCLARCRK
jgi:hypothetical protein